MPDHVHAIVMIDHNKIPHEKRNIVGMCPIKRDSVETFHETLLCHCVNQIDFEKTTAGN